MSDPFRVLAGEATAAVDFVRASGDCECAACGKPYRKHPHSEHLASDGAGGTYPYLRRLCDGRLVKL